MAGQMIPRGPGKWLLRIYLGRTAEGKKQYHAETFRGTTSQARVELTRILRQHDTRTLVRPSNLRVGDYLTSWLAGRVSIAPRTRVSYADVLRHARAALGDTLLTSLTPLQVQAWIVQMLQQGRSPRTIQYAHSILKAALAAAVDQGLLVKNPAGSVELPERRKRAPTVLSREQVATIVNDPTPGPLHALWVVLLGSGLRPQEAAGLCWDAIDLQEGWLSVRRTVVDDGHGRQHLAETVKADSQRRVALPETAVEALKAHRQTTGRIAGPVFTTSAGTLLTTTLIRRAWTRTLRRLGLPKVRLVDTRHTHATALLADGADIAWVRDRLGHKDISMTAHNYAHVLPESQRQMGARADRLLKVAP